MNGPQHYAAAERQLDVAEAEIEQYAKSAIDSTDERIHLQQSQVATARAQVHATLALAAAAIDAGSHATFSHGDGSWNVPGNNDAWVEATR